MGECPTLNRSGWTRAGHRAFAQIQAGAGAPAGSVYRGRPAPRVDGGAEGADRRRELRWWRDGVCDCTPAWVDAAAVVRLAAGGTAPRSGRFANEGRTGDQHDAFCISAWLSRADRDGSLSTFLNPDLSPPERTLAQAEGWILGVPGLIRACRERDDPVSAACNSPMSSLH
jgi:hypothetical protein